MNLPREEQCGGGDWTIVLPSFLKDILETRFEAKTDKAPNLTIGQWLAAQPAEIERRERFRVLQKYGLSAYRMGDRGRTDVR